MRFDNASTVVYYCLIQMNIINLGILAHIDAGKTSVTENLLFASGATEKCGRVDNGDTITDSMDIEKRRGITVRASTTSIIWNGVKCNIIDTPGHMDFIAEVERTFKMLDGAVLILSAKEGIQAQTKLLFSTLQKLQIPTIIFINKIDRAGVNLERLYMDTSSFHCQARSRNFSRPRSALSTPSSLRASIILTSVAILAWSVPGCHSAL